MKLTFKKYMEGFSEDQLNEQNSKIDTIAQRLKYHDWTYEYSDDGRVYRRGRQEEENLIADINSLTPEEKDQLLHHPDVEALKDRSMPQGGTIFDRVAGWAHPKQEQQPDETTDQERKQKAYEQAARLYRETGVHIGDQLQTRNGTVVVVSIQRPTAFSNIPHYTVAPVINGKPDRQHEVDVDVYTIRNWKKQHEAVATPR